MGEIREAMRLLGFEASLHWAGSWIWQAFCPAGQSQQLAFPKIYRGGSLGALVPVSVQSRPAQGK